MKRYLVLAMVIVFVLGFAGFAMATGNQYMPGSRDLEGMIGEDGKSFGPDVYMGNRIVFEGTTSDANEAILVVPDPASDIVYTMPATTGTLSLVGGAGGTLADGKIYIGNNVGGTETALGQTMSGDATIANTGALTISASAVESSMIAIANVATSDLADSSVTSVKIAIANVATSDLADSAVTSAKIAIANVATSDLADSAVTSAKIGIANVQASDMFINTVTATITAGTTGATINVEAGSILMGTNLVSGISNVFTLNRSTYAGGVWDINTAAHTGSMIINGIFIRP